ncbi:MAG: low temperature requirement protein A [Rhodoglobus sp.]
MSTSQPGRTTGVWQRPALRDDGEKHRPVGWVELFFDLVFVVIVAVLAHDLQKHIDGGGLLRFGLQFLAVFWVWNGFTYYTERFESHGLENRLFTFLAILTVAGLAIWGEDGLGHNFVGFAVSYLLARGLNILMWLRAGYHEPRFRRAALGFTGGFVASAAVIGVSFLVDERWRLPLWALAVVTDIAAPAITGRFQAGLPAISRDKFPERFGLLTMIVLGETVAGVIRGVAESNSEAGLSAATIVEAAFGLAIGFGLWWIYFDFIARRPTRPFFYAALTWVYLHILSLAGIIVVGVAIAEALIVPDAATLDPPVQALLLYGLGFTVVAVALLETTLDRGVDEPAHPLVSPLLKAAVGAAVCVVALVAPPLTPMLAIVLCTIALAIPAAYGAVVYFRRPV